MRVLVITGDKNFKAGHPRFDLQARGVSELVPLYVGPQKPFPRIPHGTFDVVTVQDPFWRGLFAWRIARKLNARFNVQLHADFKAQSWAKRMIGKFILQKADSVRVVSEKLKAQVTELGMTAPITVLPIFVDVSPYQQIVRTPSQEPLIVWVGRFEEEKDPLKAIKILRGLLERGIQTKLVMLGTGTLEKQLKVEAQDLPVEFPGWQDPKEYLAKASLVLSTSPAESWGASIIEALAAGVPVVAPDVGVAKEAGAIVAERDQLADAVVDVLNNPQSGRLQVPLLSEVEWIAEWKKSLV